MQVVTWAWMGILFLQGAAPRSEVVPVEKGTFLLYMAGKQVGRETFEHYLNGKQDVWSGEVDIQTAGSQLKQKPRLVLSSDGKPVSFDLTYSTGGPEQTFSYSFAEDSFTVTSRGSSKDSTQQFSLPANAVVLANNVIHHNILLARRYDGKKGGKQEFVALPSTPASLEARGEDNFLLSGNPLSLRHLFLSIGGVIGVNLWLDSHERLIKMDIPLQRIEVFLEGFEKIEPAITTVASIPAAHVSVDVTYSSGDHFMAGTLSLPRSHPAPLPAVILLSDTGPQNRDGDSPGVGGLKMGVFRAIAEKLSANGLAVLRYDDRGVGKSGGSFPTADITDFEGDARAAITYLRSRAEIDPRRIGLVGCNEGALLGARIAADSPDIKALVSMASPARNGEEIVRWQQKRSLERLNLREEDFKAEEQKGLAFIETIKKSDEDVAEIDGQKVNLRWFREFFASDPLAVIRRVKCPVAILQGGKDIQVPPEDAGALDRALSESDNRDHEVKIYPNLGHLFTESSGDGLAEMADTQRRISEDVLSYILGFLKKKL